MDLSEHDRWGHAVLYMGLFNKSSNQLSMFLPCLFKSSSSCNLRLNKRMFPFPPQWRIVQLVISARRSAIQDVQSQIFTCPQPSPHGGILDRSCSARADMSTLSLTLPYLHLCSAWSWWVSIGKAFCPGTWNCCSTPSSAESIKELYAWCCGTYVSLTVRNVAQGLCG